MARYNRDLFEALASAGGEVLVLPRNGDAAGMALPAGIRQRPAIFGRLRFSLVSLWAAWRYRPFDVVFCGHVYMAPLAALLARLLGARYWLQAHGAEVWRDRRDVVRRAIEAADQVTTVSRGTRKSLLGWVDLAPERVRVLPNTVDARFTPGPPSSALRAAPAARAGPDPARRRPSGGERALQGPRTGVRGLAGVARALPRHRLCRGRRRRRSRPSRGARRRARRRGGRGALSRLRARRGVCPTSIAWLTSSSCRAPKKGSASSTSRPPPVGCG